MVDYFIMIRRHITDHLLQALADTPVLPAHFFRTGSDVVLEDSAGRLLGLEVKATATLGRADGRGLKALAEAVGQRWIRGAILYTGTEVIPFGSNLHGLPLPLLWTAHK